MKFENTKVWGFESAIRGMRNPKESWNKSDSYSFVGRLNENGTEHLCDIIDSEHCVYFALGENDKKLAQTLIAGGSEHRKFMRQIFVSVDITAPLFWWKEASTYQVGTTANSTSTMHKLTSKPITLDLFETDDFNPDLEVYHNVNEESDYVGDIAGQLIFYLEQIRQKYLKTKDKRYWKELVRWLPEGWLQTRTWTGTYENLYSMIRQRAGHKLNEWSGHDNADLTNFISWTQTLPYAEELLYHNQVIYFGTRNGAA